MNARGPLIYGNGVCRRWIVVVVDGRGVRNDESCPCRMTTRCSKQARKFRVLRVWQAKTNPARSSTVGQSHTWGSLYIIIGGIKRVRHGIEFGASAP